MECDTIGQATTISGLDIPAFKSVFVKFLRAALSKMSLDQMQAASNSLSEIQRSAIGDYLGNTGLSELTRHLDDTKVTWIHDRWQAKTELDELGFRSLYPDIIAAFDKSLTKPQLESSLKSLTPEDFAAQSLYLGNHGRRSLFSKMSKEGVCTILDLTPDWVFIAAGKLAHQSLSSYTCILEKQERLGSKLQETETIEVKFRESPKSVYMKWLAGPFKGREVIFNSSLLGSAQIRVREGGLLGVLPVTISLDNPIARRGTNHSITELGMRYLLDLIESDYLKGAPRNDIQRVNHGVVQLDGRPVYKLESILPQNPALGYYCYRIVHYMDYIDDLEVKADIFKSDNSLYESYYYRSIKLEAPVSDLDFDPKNPAYRLK